MPPRRLRSGGTRRRQCWPLPVAAASGRGFQAVESGHPTRRAARATRQYGGGCRTVGGVRVSGSRADRCPPQRTSSAGRPEMNTAALLVVAVALGQGKTGADIRLGGSWSRFGVRFFGRLNPSVGGISHCRGHHQRAVDVI